MAGFLKFLDAMEEDFDTCHTVNESCDDVIEEEVEEEEEVEIVRPKKTVVNNTIYKKRMVSELNRFGLNESAIKEIIYNIFDDSEYVVETKQPSTFKQRMAKHKQVPPVNSISDMAGDILDGVDEMPDAYSQNIVYNTQQPQQMVQNSAPIYSPPIQSNMGTVNSMNVEGIGHVAAAPQKPMLQMPEGFEAPPPAEPTNQHQAMGILAPPSNEHVGGGTSMPQQYAMPEGASMPPLEQTNPQHAMNIMAEPGMEHIGNVNPPSDIANHASSLLG